MDCIFCKIVARIVPSEFVYEDAATVAFKDMHPSAPVHLLVVPREHIESIAHLEPEHRDLVASVMFAGKTVAEQASLKGYKLVFNVGRDGGQVVGHLHLHVLGGWLNGEGKGLPHPRLDK